MNSSYGFYVTRRNLNKKDNWLFGMNFNWLLKRTKKELRKKKNDKKTLKENLFWKVICLLDINQLSSKKKIIALFMKMLMKDL